MPRMDYLLKLESLHSMTISQYRDGCRHLSNSVTGNLRKLFEVCLYMFVICEFGRHVPRKCAVVVSILTNEFIHS